MSNSAKVYKIARVVFAQLSLSTLNQRLKDFSFKINNICNITRFSNFHHSKHIVNIVSFYSNKVIRQYSFILTSNKIYKCLSKIEFNLSNNDLFSFNDISTIKVIFGLNEYIIRFIFPNIDIEKRVNTEKSLEQFCYLQSKNLRNFNSSNKRNAYQSFINNRKLTIVLIINSDTEKITLINSQLNNLYFKKHIIAYQILYL